MSNLGPWLGRFWGDGLIKANPLAVNQAVIDWSRSDPEGLLAAARYIAAKKPLAKDENARRLMDLMAAEPNPNGPRHYFINQLLRARPEALVEAIQIMNAHPDEIVRVLSRFAYTDVQTIGGYLDRDLPNPNIDGN